jgi:hypothetical protein
MRHTGELSAMIGLFLSGICFVIPFIIPKCNATIKLYWTGYCILVGMIGGTVLDITSYDLIIAIPVGVIVGYLGRNRDPSLFA